VRAVHNFADHHDYKLEEVEGLCEEGAELLVTAKDAVKLRALGVSCASLEVEIDIVAGEEHLRDLVVATLRGTSSA
jgi:tetraacyldisaccharide-1-P 4'-kinase